MNRKHSKTGTPLFWVWCKMRDRVKSGHKQSKYYHDRGIRVCKEWDSFSSFEAWALCNGYEKGLQLDRRDNNEGYSPDNCRFVTPFRNNINRSNTIIVEYLGETLPLADLNIRLNWTKRHYRNIRDRIGRGWNIIDAIVLADDIYHKSKKTTPITL